MSGYYCCECLEPGWEQRPLERCPKCKENVCEMCESMHERDCEAIVESDD